MGPAAATRPLAGVWPGVWAGPDFSISGSALNELKPLFEAHGPAVWRTVYRLLNHHGDAQDCYQETFLAAWKASRDGDVRDWPSLLKTIATRRAIDRLRQRYRQGERTGPLAAEAGLPAHGGAPPDAALEAAELRERVGQALPRLPERQAQAFWLRPVEQMIRTEIAQHLGVEPGNAAVLVSRAARVAWRFFSFLSAFTKGRSFR